MRSRASLAGVACVASASAISRSVTTCDRVSRLAAGTLAGGCSEDDDDQDDASVDKDVMEDVDESAGDGDDEDGKEDKASVGCGRASAPPGPSASKQGLLKPPRPPTASYGGGGLSSVTGCGDQNKPPSNPGDKLKREEFSSPRIRTWQRKLAVSGPLMASS